jgi:hypothetical protein
MKNPIYTKVLLLGMLMTMCLSATLHSQGIFLLNDTINLTPGIPKSVDILAKDLIPSGDSIRISVSVNDNGFVYSTGRSGSVFTFVARFGGASQCTGTYTVHDYTLDTTLTAALIFQVRDKSYDSLYLNNINARFDANGNHFYNVGAGHAQFEVPKFSGKNTIFTSSFWIGGLDQDSVLHLAAYRYGQGPSDGGAWSHFDFYAGPVMDSSAYSIYQDTLWNYIWNLKKSQIEYHKAHWSDAGYKPIHDILTWPGNGNTSLGQAAQLAPFFDRNGNGIYNPMDGDYPLIRGDQAMFFIFNDDRNFHSETQGNKLKVEIHGMAYAFDLPGDTAFNNTIFMNYKIYNRSDKTYYKTYFGIFTDTDIGWAYDDFIGCDVQRSFFYGYNGTPIDGTGQSFAYGANPPAQSTAILAGPYMDPDGLDNPKVDSHGHQLCNESVNGVGFGDGIVDNERLGMTNFMYLNNSGSVPGYMTDPLYSPQYYELLQSIWKDSVPLKYGGNGHYPSSYGSTCKYMFPGISDTLCWGAGCILQSPLNWTEFTADNAPYDRRGIGSSGPFTFQPGQEQDFDFAYTFARDYTGTYPGGSIGKLGDLTDTIRKYFLTNILPDGSSFNGIGNITGNSSLQAQLFPNPASSVLYIRFDRIVNDPVNIRIINNNGTMIRSEEYTPVNRMITLDISRLSAGLYFISIETKDQIITKKVSILR